MQGTQEHDDMARATASVMGKRDEKKRPGQELGWKREGGDTGCIPPTPRKHLYPWFPLFTLGPSDSISCSASGPSGSFFCPPPLDFPHRQIFR